MKKWEHKALSCKYLQEGLDQVNKGYAKEGWQICAMTAISHLCVLILKREIVAKQLTDTMRENEENCRLLGKSGSREAKLLTEIDGLKREIALLKIALSIIKDMENEMPKGGFDKLSFFEHQFAHAQNIAEDALKPYKDSDNG